MCPIVVVGVGVEGSSVSRIILLLAGEPVDELSLLARDGELYPSFWFSC